MLLDTCLTLQHQQLLTKRDPCNTERFASGKLHGHARLKLRAEHLQVCQGLTVAAEKWQRRLHKFAQAQRPSEAPANQAFQHIQHHPGL